MPRHLRRPTNRDNGSIMLALLLIIIVSSLVIITTATAVAGLRKSQHARDFALAQQAADAAVNDALIWLNEQGYRNDPVPSPTSARTGSIGHITWSWYVDSSLPGDSGYTLLIRAGRGDGSFTRQYEADLSGTEIPDTGAVYLENGQPRYVVSPDAGFATGFFANSEAFLGQGTIVTSYDAGTGNVDSGNGRISTNGEVSLDDGVTADQVMLYNGTAQPYTERCVGDPCQTIPVRLQPIAYGVSDECTPGAPGCTAPTEFITEWCDNSTPAKTARPWVASTENRDLTSADDGACFSSMIFDQPTTVTGPVEAYVTGDVTVTEGVTVNMTSANPTPDAAALRIYSQGQHVTLHGGAAASSATRTAWLLWAPNADCAGSGTGHVRVYGAMICDRLTTTGTWQLHVSDQALDQRDPTDTGRARVWSLSRFSER